jgi:hypothetical protein
VSDEKGFPIIVIERVLLGRHILFRVNPGLVNRDFTVPSSGRMG